MDAGGRQRAAMIPASAATTTIRVPGSGPAANGRRGIVVPSARAIRRQCRAAPGRITPRFGWVSSRRKHEGGGVSLQIGVLFGLLAVMVYLFLTEKLPVDLTAFLGLLVLVAAGYVKPEEAFTGFASPAVITMLSVFFISAGLLNTGVADAVGRRVHSLVGDREVPLIVLLMVASALLSAFMNNVAATAVLLPAVASLARQAGISPSRLFMPLAFGAILGGTTTLVGTPPNILVAGVIEAKGLRPLQLFDFAPVGLALLAAGVVYMITIGRRLLPERSRGLSAARPRSLPSVYGLDESMVSVHVPPGSALDGVSLRDAQIGSALGAQVVAIVRRGRELLAPGADEIIRGDDHLVVQGHFDDMESCLKVRGISVEEGASFDLRDAAGDVDGALLRIDADSALVGQTVAALRFRERFGAVVAARFRDGRPRHDPLLAEQPLEAGEELLVLGGAEKIAALAARDDLTTVAAGSAAIARLEEHLLVIQVPEDSLLVGATVADSRIRALAGLTIVGLLRDGRTRLVTTAGELIEAGDRLLVSGDAQRVRALLRAGEVSIRGKTQTPRLESDDLAVVEAVIAPRANLAGRTVRDLAFRDRYDLKVLAIWSNGKPIRSALADKPLATGDGLLLQGAPEKIRLLASDPDFVVLSESEPTPRRTGRAPFALASLALMVVLVVSGIFPIQVAAFAGAVLAVLTGALTMPEAYRAVEWRAIFLVAAILPVGIAMERTGAAALLADTVVGTAGPLGPYAVLAMLVALSSLLSQGLDGAPTVVLLAPVVLRAADELKLSPYPLLIGVAFAASAAFMTPFSHKANLLVMGAGGYRSMDYVKVGTPLTLVVFVLITLLVPVFFPF